MVASNRKRRNCIPFIEKEGIRIEDPQGIKREATAFLKRIFTEEYTNRPTLQGQDFRHLSSEQPSSLTAPFRTEEIDSAMASCNPDKSPDPQWFQF